VGLDDVVPEFDNGNLNANGKHVVVIGGGDTAMDCVRTAIRQQAASVTCLYRRDRENMPGSAREVRYAEEEGVVFRWLSAPLGFEGARRVEHVLVQPMRLGAMDASGRRMPEAIPDSREKLPANLVIMALGFDAEDLPALFNAPQLQLSPYGTLLTNAHGMTSVDGVFAAGDIVRGASLVVWAIHDGREAAENMHRHMLAKRSEKAA
jgi:glutamate synthase (NADPH/NADH) small chain